jgi:hypothetical protein
LPPFEPAEPDMLARALGPGRMPWPMRRYPRACGVAMLAVGAWGIHVIATLSSEGGIYMTSFPAIAMIALVLGAWLVLTGRPSDERGYSPSWWNVGYVTAVALGVVIALVVQAIWL